MKLHQKLQALPNPPQYILFSATYDDDVTEKIDKMILEANQMALKIERLKLE